MNIFSEAYGYDEYEAHLENQAAIQNEKLLSKLKAIWAAIAKAVRS